MGCSTYVGLGIVTGPLTSGKTASFPVAEFGVDSSKADQRAVRLNTGSFRGISREIRSHLSAELQKWILNHGSARKGFALKTTLRRQITFAQPQLTREDGLWSAIRELLHTS
jgi:hypothetical protein